MQGSRFAVSRYLEDTSFKFWIPVFNFGYQMLKPWYPTWIPRNLCLNTNIYHNISKTLA